jgi:hypothetical protein
MLGPGPMRGVDRVVRRCRVVHELAGCSRPRTRHRQRRRCGAIGGGLHRVLRNLGGAAGAGGRRSGRRRGGVTAGVDASALVVARGRCDGGRRGVARRRAGIGAAEPGAAVRSADAGPRATTGPRPGRAAGDRTRMVRGRCSCYRAGRGAGGATPSGALVPPTARAGCDHRRRGSRAGGGPHGGGRPDTGPRCAGGARPRPRHVSVSPPGWREPR